MILAPRAILFDMDGTLTEPLLDFPTIKSEMGIGSGPILESLAEMPEAERRRAEAVLLRHEERAAADSTLNPGCQELIRLVHERGIATALITRNSRASVEVVLARHGLPFEVLITREFGQFKPDPAPLRHACRILRVSVESAWMVGDGQYDIEAGREAGCHTVWVSHGRARPFAAAPDRTVRDLLELTDLLRTGLKQQNGTL